MVCCRPIESQSMSAWIDVAGRSGSGYSGARPAPVLLERENMRTLFFSLALIVSAPAFAEEITETWNGDLKSGLVITDPSIRVERFSNGLTFMRGKVVPLTDDVPEGTPTCSLILGGKSNQSRVLRDGETFRFPGVSAGVHRGDLKVYFRTQVGFQIDATQPSFYCSMNGARGKLTTQAIAKILGKNAQFLVVEGFDDVMVKAVDALKSFAHNLLAPSVSERSQVIRDALRIDGAGGGDVRGAL
jgi:hypothetical protein